MATITSSVINFQQRYLQVTIDDYVDAVDANKFILSFNNNAVSYTLENSSVYIDTTYDLETGSPSTVVTFYWDSSLANNILLLGYYIPTSYFPNGTVVTVSANVNAANPDITTSYSRVLTYANGGATGSPDFPVLTSFNFLRNSNINQQVAATFSNPVQGETVVFPQAFTFTNPSTGNSYALTGGNILSGNGVTQTIQLNSTDISALAAANLAQSEETTFLQIGQGGVTDTWYQQLTPTLTPFPVSQYLTNNPTYQGQDLGYVRQPLSRMFLLGGAEGQTITTDGQGNLSFTDPWNPLTNTRDVRANSFLGDGSQLTGIDLSTYVGSVGNGNSATSIYGNVIAGFTNLPGNLWYNAVPDSSASIVANINFTDGAVGNVNADPNQYLFYAAVGSFYANNRAVIFRPSGSSSNNWGSFETAIQGSQSGQITFSGAYGNVDDSGTQLQFTAVTYDPLSDLVNDRFCAIGRLAAGGTGDYQGAQLFYTTNPSSLAWDNYFVIEVATDFPSSIITDMVSSGTDGYGIVAVGDGGAGSTASTQIYNIFYNGDGYSYTSFYPNSAFTKLRLSKVRYQTGLGFVALGSAFLAQTSNTFPPYVTTVSSTSAAWTVTQINSTTVSTVNYVNDGVSLACQSIVWAGDRWIVFGSYQTSQPATGTPNTNLGFYSTNGTTWTQFTPTFADTANSFGIPYLTDLAYVNNTLIATGVSATSNGNILVYTSTNNGFTWINSSNNYQTNLSANRFSPSVSPGPVIRSISTDTVNQIIYSVGSNVGNGLILSSQLRTLRGLDIRGNLTIFGNAGTSGQVLTSQGAGNIPVWSTPTGGSSNYSNANVANYLPTYTGNVGAGNVNLVGSGNLTLVSAGNIVLTPTTNVVVSTGFLIGNGRYLTGITGVGGTGTPTGANTQVQYNNNGQFGASAAFTFDQQSNVLSVRGNVSSNVVNTVGAGNLVITSQTGITLVPTGSNVGVSGNLTSSGNVQGGNVSARNNMISSSYLTTGFGNLVISSLSGINIVPGNILGLGGGNANILGRLFASGITSYGNIIGSTIYGNGDVMISESLARLTTNIVSTASITAQNFYGNFNITSITGSPIVSISSNITTLANIQGGGIISTGSVYANNFTSLGTNNLTISSSSNILLTTAALGNVTINSGLITPRLSLSSGNVRLGLLAGAQSNSAVAGNSTFVTSTSAIAIGQEAGRYSQGQAIAIGPSAGRTSQGSDGIAIGSSAAFSTQGNRAVAVGSGAGSQLQGQQAVAVGYNAGLSSQGGNAVAIGNSAGQTSQSANAIAIGTLAAFTGQGANAIAIGNNAGGRNQGTNSIAIGCGAGANTLSPTTITQATNSIIINATGANLVNVIGGTPATNSLFIAPIRSTFSPLPTNTTSVYNFGNTLYYEPTTSEVYYANTAFTGAALTPVGSMFIASGQSGTAPGAVITIAAGGLSLYNVGSTAAITTLPAGTYRCLGGFGTTTPTNMALWQRVS